MEFVKGGGGGNQKLSPDGRVNVLEGDFEPVEALGFGGCHEISVLYERVLVFFVGRLRPGATESKYNITRHERK
jgi:hypothetical protein